MDAALQTARNGSKEPSGQNVNYYFISSPLHLIFSVTTALSHPNDINVAVVDYYIESNRSLFTEALENSGIFETVTSFSDAHIKSKLSKRKARLKKLTELIKKWAPSRVYTGSDRSVEFQYTMYMANSGKGVVEGHYLDEGTQTYLGHRNMHSVTHNYIEPLLKKMAYGKWWSSPRMIGASKWISTVHATFPALVHPVLQTKIVKSISPDNFKTPAFDKFNKGLLALANIDVEPLKQVDYVVLLTGDSFYDDVNVHLDKMIEILTGQTKKSRIALKAHPRSKHIEHFKQRHPELIHIDNRVGFELLLPQFSESCTFIGDISSTLFTIRWLSDKQNVLAVKLQQKTPQHFSEPLAKLLSEVEVQQLSYDELAQRIAVT